MLRIDNKAISTNVFDILLDIRKIITNGKLKDIKQRGKNITVTCPFHKDGLEQNPSCNIYVGEDDKVEYGYFKCFTCSEQGPFYKFVAACFNKDEEWAKNWLLDNYSDGLVEYQVVLPEITIGQEQEEELSDSALSTLESWHPYLAKRKITPEVAKQFELGYDKESKSIVFPVRDEQGKLRLLTRRSVIDKTFIIDANKEKPVYLLYYLLDNNITTAVICESQINALTCHTYHLPGVALFGTGSDLQYQILNKSPIRHYILCFDGDMAGDNGIRKFLKNIRKDVLVSIVNIPRGKDVNDLTKEEFLDCLERADLPVAKLIEIYDTHINALKK